MADVASLSIDLPEADCLLVVPPAGRLNWPHLGVHVLQACARQAGFEVAVLYMNHLYARLVGARAYEALSVVPTDWFIGERLFSRAAFGAPRLGFRTGAFFEDLERANAREAQAPVLPGEEPPLLIGRDHLLAWEEAAFALVPVVAEAIAARRYAVVGATSHFDQTAPSLAVLQRVRALSPGTKVIIGGANCEDELAHGMRSLSAVVDHVFSGESEETFVRFLQDVRDGRDPGPPIITGAPCTDMDALPTPRFEEYFAQVQRVTDLTDELWVMYETSRGCWWGQKHHCTFCGFNALGMGFREKSPERVVEELNEILADAPTRRVHMTDNIMPHRYHRSLVPRLRAEVGELVIWYEMKANLTLEQVRNLWEGGRMTIQAGVEALDTELLQLMRKGVSARQNVALLRYARTVGMKVQWNLLWGLPGDSAEPFVRTLALLPLLRHLCPPYMLTHLILDRYSPYHDEPEAFGIENLRPLDGYADVFPAEADLERVAYHFHGDYPSGSRGALEVMDAINEEIGRWQAGWRREPSQRPALQVNRVGPGRYVLVDTRGLGGPPTVYLNEAQAQAVLVGGPLERVRAARWAIDNHFAVALDGWCTPLATAPYRLLAELEARPREEAQEAAPLQVISLGS